MPSVPYRRDLFSVPPPTVAPTATDRRVVARVRTFNSEWTYLRWRSFIFFSDYRSCAKNVEIIQASKWAEEFAIHIAGAFRITNNFGTDVSDI